MPLSAVVSTAYLGTDLADVDLSRFKKGRPLIPVVLRDFDEERINLRGLERNQLFRLNTARSKKSYENCREKAGHKQAFVNELFKQIELRLDKFFESPCFDDSCARSLLPENKHFTETNAAPIPLDSKEFNAQTIEHIAAQSQNALDMLEKWATAPTKDGPIFAAVLGEYGIGKTTTLKQLTHKLLERRKEDQSVPLPIFIDLRLIPLP